MSDAENKYERNLRHSIGSFLLESHMTAEGGVRPSGTDCGIC